MHRFFATAPAGLAILDTSFRYLHINRMLAEINGYPVEHHLGKTLQDVLPEFSPILLPFCEQVRDTLKAAINIEFSGEACSRPGLIRHWEAGIVPILNEKGELDAIGMAVIETTQRKSLEAQLLQAQKLESVGRLAGGVAHDFNNLLCVIQGHAFLLQSSSHTALDQDSIQEILRASERAAAVTRQLLTFSRKQAVQPRNVNLNEAISATTKMLRRLVGEDVEVQTDLAKDLPMIHADPGMMDQVLMNLAVNARDAMPKGGALRITTAARTISAADSTVHAEAAPGDFVVLSVADSGSGIPANILPHIFEPFYTTKELGKGTGLGLSMVYGIVKQHKGWIAVRTKLDKGTTFEIYLPIHPRPEAATESVARVEKNVRGRENVLLVEDDNDLRFLTRKSLERLGYGVEEASAGPQALDIWRKSRDEIDVVVTDVIMPNGMSGVDLAAEIERDKPGFPVIFMSGYSNELLDQSHEFPRNGGYLPKPFRPSELAQLIRSKLEAPSVVS